jgi:hypothetical protein
MGTKQRERSGSVRIEELGSEKFALTVTFDGQDFACGTYLNRAAAAQAGKLFIDRKEGEETARRRRPKGK